MLRSAVAALWPLLSLLHNYCNRSGAMPQVMSVALLPDASNSILADAKFQNTGLERTAALREDIQWMQQAHNLPAPVVEEDGPGKLYALHLQQLARDDPQFFICHYYNYFFAHTAGGRMIGTKVAQMLLDGKELKFYQYSGDVAELLDGVRASINELAEQWTREQKDHCLRETADAFQYSGKLMKCMTE
eukprot:GHRQ01023009.1.p1 GENE.GHRQ01023009.1~~GHRQ01023009.1.p1  ORF type:complete len:189 (+),score=66.29 GHRQ01023009.1:189-755(+)